MKTNNLKTIMTAFAVIATVSFSNVAMSGEEITLPVISRPSALEEGTQKDLSAAQVAELLPWAKNSKMFLNDMLDNIQSLSTTDKIDRLVEGIESTVNESAPKNSELLMRYALNRGLVLNTILSKEMAADTVGSSDAKLRVLLSSVKMAIKYYDTDMETLTKKTKAPFIIFGLDYYEFLAELNKSIFDASAQYLIQRTSLEWLQWDMYRDLNNTTYTPQIVKINNALKLFPVKKLTDAQSIAYIRQMKALAIQLKIRETVLETDRTLKTAEEIRVSRERNEKSKLKVGDRVIYVGVHFNEIGTIIAVQADGLYSLRYTDGAIQSNAKRSDLAVTNGCGEILCAGEKVLVPEKSNAFANVIGVQMDGKYVLRFTSGELSDRVGQNWGPGEIAKLSGCSDGFCVNDKIINTNKNATAIVYAIQTEGRFVLQFTSAEFDGQIGAGWTKPYMVKEGAN